MITAIAFEEVKQKQFRVEPDASRGEGGVLNTPFLGSLSDRTSLHLPQAFLSQGDPGRSSGTHYHAVDQYQIVIGGGGRMGRHALAPCGVHFARAFTPYGPLVADSVKGLTTFTLRNHHDPLGAQRFPEKQAVLKTMTERRPWQIFVPNVAFPDAGPSGVLIQAIPGIQDDSGLAAHALTMKPSAKAAAPDHSLSDGQYLLVLKGSVIHDGHERKSYALIFISQGDGPYSIHAGPAGLEGLILNFPRSNNRAADVLPKQGWRCSMCAYVYDATKGSIDDGIGAGTRWQDLPPAWCCPNCSSPKSGFKDS